VPYKVEVNRHTKKQRLVWYATPRGKVAPRTEAGQFNRRVVLRDGKPVFHFTKGYR